MHRQLGGFGWLSGDKRKRYDNLSNQEINRLTGEVFDQHLEQEKTNVFNSRAGTAIQDYNLHGKNHKNYATWQDNYRKADISTYSGVNRRIADSWEKIMNGGLNDQDRLKEFENFRTVTLLRWMLMVDKKNIKVMNMVN